MKRLALVLLAVSLAACTTYQGYGYRDDGYYDDRYYEGPNVYRGSPAQDRYYYDDYGYSGYDGFGYGAYPYYYSSLWPIYHGYYDPFYNPHFHYGITYFPRSYYGFGYGGFGYPRYQPYAPYRYSWYDNYFGFGLHHERRDHRRGDSLGQRSAFGSARNQAERMAVWTGADRIGQGNGRFRGQRPANETGVRNRGQRGPVVPQRSGPMTPARGQVPAPRPSSRQYDRGGRNTPVPQANALGAPSDREPNRAWQSDQRLPRSPGAGPAGRDGRFREARIGAFPVVRPARDAPATLVDQGGSAIPSRRAFRPAAAPATLDRDDAVGSVGPGSRSANRPHVEAQDRRQFNQPQAAWPANAVRPSVEAQPRADRLPPATGGGYRSPAPGSRPRSDLRAGPTAPAAPQYRLVQPAPAAPARRPERSRRDEGDADEGARRRPR
ncbi:MAG: hypothetical protein AB7V26_04425 [Lysobacterales bacterium]